MCTSVTRCGGLQAGKLPLWRSEKVDSVSTFPRFLTSTCLNLQFFWSREQLWICRDGWWSPGGFGGGEGLSSLREQFSENSCSQWLSSAPRKPFHRRSKRSTWNYGQTWKCCATKEVYCKDTQGKYSALDWYLLPLQLRGWRTWKCFDEQVCTRFSKKTINSNFTGSSCRLHAHRLIRFLSALTLFCISVPADRGEIVSGKGKAAGVGALKMQGEEGRGHAGRNYRKCPIRKISSKCNCELWARLVSGWSWKQSSDCVGCVCVLCMCTWMFCVLVFNRLWIKPVLIGTEISFHSTLPQV